MHLKLLLPISVQLHLFPLLVLRLNVLALCMTSSANKLANVNFSSRYDTDYTTYQDEAMLASDDDQTFIAICHKFVCHGPSHVFYSTHNFIYNLCLHQVRCMLKCLHKASQTTVNNLQRLIVELIIYHSFITWYGLIIICCFVFKNSLKLWPYSISTKCFYIAQGIKLTYVSLVYTHLS